MSEVFDDRDEEYLEQRANVIEQAKEAREDAEERHNALLGAAANDEEATIEEYDTAHIGDAELTVKTDVSGETLRKLDKLFNDHLAPGRQLDVNIDVLTDQTVAIEANGVTAESDGDIRLFWRDFFDQHGVETMGSIARERVIEEPVGLEQERKQEAMQSFPENRSSPRDRSPREWRS